MNRVKTQFEKNRDKAKKFRLENKKRINNLKKIGYPF